MNGKPPFKGDKLPNIDYKIVWNFTNLLPNEGEANLKF